MVSHPGLRACTSARGAWAATASDAGSHFGVYGQPHPDPAHAGVSASIRVRSIRGKQYLRKLQKKNSNKIRLMAGAGDVIVDAGIRPPPDDILGDVHNEGMHMTNSETALKKTS